VDHLELHCSQGESIPLFEVMVDEGRGGLVGYIDRSTGSGSKLGVASHEVRMGMGQNDGIQLQPVAREVSDVSANVPFWIDHRRLISRRDQVRSVRQSGNKESFDMHPILPRGLPSDLGRSI